MPVKQRDSFVLVMRVAALAGLILWGLAAPAPAPAWQTYLVSVSTTGGLADAQSESSRISADGRYVLFRSLATNLVDNDTNGMPDLFLRDLLTGQTTRVSLGNDAAQADNTTWSGDLSADGRYVVFDSAATNLVEGDTNGRTDIFVRDLQTGVTTRINLAPNGDQADGSSFDPHLSGDGRYVVYESFATNLVEGETNGQNDVFVYDTVSRTTTRVSVKSDGTEGNNVSEDGQISADGRWVVFESGANNLVEGDNNAVKDVFLHDCQTGETVRLSLNTAGEEANNGSSTPWISDDGRYAVFYSVANNLVAGDTNLVGEIFQRDVVAGTTTRLSLGSGGVEGDQESNEPSQNAAGSRVTFHSTATNLVASDLNGVGDVFLRDLASGVNQIISLDSQGRAANGNSYDGKLARQADYVTFTSGADNLVNLDTNAAADVFVRGPFLENAVDNPTLDLTTSFDSPWITNPLVKHQGVNAAQAGPVGDGETSWLEMTLTGPGVISFWCKVSSEAGDDYLEFRLGGTLLSGRLSGEVGWTRKVYSIPAGTYTFRWAYRKGAAGAAGDDTAWVDQVEWGTSTRKTMYRAYNEALQYHFFTVKQAEFNNAVAAGYQNESTQPSKLFYMSAEQAPGTVALHRLYNPNSGRHYYTKSNAERDALVAAGWNFERDEGYLFTSADAAPADATEVFHLYHPTIGTHLYTKSASEAAWVVANIPPWQQHTSLGWAYNSLTVGARYAAEDDPVSPDSDLLRDAALQAGVDLTRLAAWQALTAAQAGPKAEEGSTAAPAAVTSDSLASNLASFAGLTGGLGSAAGGLIPRRDFDGDGADDLVWLDPATGRVSLVLMGPAGPREVMALGTVADLNWRLHDVADLDASGGPDLVWWNPVSGEVSFWLLAGVTVTSRPVVGQAPAGATLAGVGDYDGDGRVDLAWRAADGSLSLTTPR
ncbi:MAG: hypothetical protein KQJ78_12930 [Deltaproteobacteria bacterium]|nr:hypothetical protein [Deltaproteobacteria bacterium]